MAFGPGLHVFPGGGVDSGDSEPALAAHSIRSAREAARAIGDNVDPEPALALHVAAIRELFEEAGILLTDPATRESEIAEFRARLGAGMSFERALEGLEVRLATDRLAPLAHWTTPAFMPRRFSTWFFAADLPAGAVPLFAPDEVAAHRWLTPSRALEKVAAGEVQMWVPTTSTLQRLVETAASTAAEVAARIRFTRIEPPRIVEERPALVRIAFGAVGGLPGRVGEATLHGHRRLVLVDPGDASDEALDLIAAVVARRGGVIQAIVLTRSDPDHAAAAEALAIPLAIPILVAPGAGRFLTYPTREVSDGDVLPADIDLTARLGPAGSGRLAVVAASAGE